MPDRLYPRTDGRSKISDEDLEREINEDFKRNPSEFASKIVSVDSIPSSRYFVRKTSANGIAQIRKWL